MSQWQQDVTGGKGQSSSVFLGEQMLISLTDSSLGHGTYKPVPILLTAMVDIQKGWQKLYGLQDKK